MDITQEITVKIINKNNLDRIHELFEVVKRTILDNFPEYSERIKEYLIRIDNLNQTVKNAGVILGAYLNNKLVGYLIARKFYGGVGYCEWLGVLKEHQRQGIGGKLLREYENIALKNGVHNLQLESDIRNVEFYKKQGYKVLCLDKKGYFGTDNYILKKLIQTPKEENFLRIV